MPVELPDLAARRPDILLARLAAYANDPMWADHAEVPKSVLRQAIQRIHELEAEVISWREQNGAGLVDYLTTRTDQ